MLPPMRKRAWLIILGAIAVVTLTLWLSRPTPEPSYNGHTLSYWLDRIDVNYAGEARRSDTSTSEAEAAEAISRIGTNALPLLIKRLSSHPGRASQFLHSTLLRLPPETRPQWLLRRTDPDDVRYQAQTAAAAFWVLGPAGRPALQDLNRIMSDARSPDNAALAQIALALVGKDALPFLLARLQDTNAPNRADAMSCISRYPALRTNAAPAIPTLMGCLRDKDAAVRSAATNTLLEIAPEALTNAPPAH